MLNGISNSTQFPAPATHQIALKTRFSTLIVLALCLCACTETRRVGVDIKPVQMPAWTRDGRHPDFPAESFLAAYASGESPAQARAASDMQLEAAIAAFALSLGEKQLANTRFAEIVTQSAQWLRVPEFGGAISHDAAGDGFEVVSVSAISREELRFRAQSMLSPALDALAANSTPPELDDVTKSVALWGERFVLAARALALSLLCGKFDRGAHAASEEAAIVLHELPRRLEAALGGGLQRARIMGGAKNELNLSLLFKGRYPSGLRVLWRVEPPAVGVLSGFSEVNLTGQAYCRVLSISGIGGETAGVSCSPDLDAMCGRRLGIAAMNWRWPVTVPSRKNVLLGMNVKERFGSAGTKPVFTDACIEWARLNEVTLQDDIAPNARAPYVYPILIEGLIDVDVRKERGLLVAYAKGNVALKDVLDDAVLFRFSPSVVLEAEQDSDAKELALQAQREAAGDTLLEFGARILGLFPQTTQAR